MRCISRERTRCRLITTANTTWRTYNILRFICHKLIAVKHCINDVCVKSSEISMYCFRSDMGCIPYERLMVIDLWQTQPLGLRKSHITLQLHIESCSITSNLTGCISCEKVIADHISVSQGDVSVYE